MKKIENTNEIKTHDENDNRSTIDNIDAIPVISNVVEISYQRAEPGEDDIITGYEQFPSVENPINIDILERLHEIKHKYHSDMNTRYPRKT